MKLGGSSQQKPEQERSHGMIEQMSLVMLPRKFSCLVCQGRMWKSNPCHLALRGSSIECIDTAGRAHQIKAVPASLLKSRLFTTILRLAPY